MKSLHWDAYVHFYATSYAAEPIASNHFEETKATKKPSLAPFEMHRQLTASNPSYYYYDGYFRHKRDDSRRNPEWGHQENEIYGVNLRSPKIRTKRLTGNRLQVTWDTSPLNPHLMQYCIVINTRRDYPTLCGAKGERFGVLPPDLMHVSYYYPEIVLSDNLGASGDDSYYSFRKRRHHRQTMDQGKKLHKDIIIGCVNKKTKYIVNDLEERRLYYLNVFVKDTSTNLTYPYVRTTLKYTVPKVMDSFKYLKFCIRNGQVFIYS